MMSRLFVSSCLIAGFAGGAAAQASGVVGGSEPAAFAIGFIDSPPVCHEYQGALQISGGTIWLLRSRSGSGRGAGGFSKPVDDETHLYRVMTDGCVLDITLRAQLYRDGDWTSLPVPRWMRPSLPPEQRLTPEVRRRLEELRSAPAQRRQDGTSPPTAAGPSADWLQGPGDLPRKIRINWQTGGSGSFFNFDGMPEHCLDVVGEVRVDQRGIVFEFPTDVPDDINHFSTDLRRFDDFRGQLALIRNGCRVEITVGKAMRRDDRWLPIPIAAMVRSP
jgi:hypothetical protein